MTAHPLSAAVGRLVHCFARAAVKWTRQGNGTWKSSGGRVLSDASYQRMQARVKEAKGKGGKAKAKPAAKPADTGDQKKTVEAPRPAAKAGPPGTVKNVYGQPIPAEAGALPGEPGYSPKPAAKSPPAAAPAKPGGLDLATRVQAVDILAQKKAREAGAARNAPAPKPPELPAGTPKPPPPSTADMQFINDAAKKDEGRFGKKVAEFLRGSLAYLVGMLTAGNGAAYGALAGLALGGPLGLAIGTAVGGGLGGRVGGNLAKKTYSVLGGAGRVAATVRKAARKVLPKAAKRVNLETPVFAEAPGGAAPPGLDPVALLTARLKAVYARRGEPTPEIDEKVVMAALAMASLAADQQEGKGAVAAMSEGVAVLTRTARRLATG